MSKAEDLARKLKALADKGVGGEKTNAVVMLQKLLDKHGLTIEDIEGEKIQGFDIRIQKAQKQFFYQVIANVVPGEEPVIEKYTYRRSWYRVNVTATQWVEIEQKFRFFWREYQSQIGIFYKAFIQRNKLYRTLTEEERAAKKDEDDELTEEDIRMLEMMRGIKPASYHKQIANK